MAEHEIEKKNSNESKATMAELKREQDEKRPQLKIYNNGLQY
jgi:hypothetical protein